VSGKKITVELQIFGGDGGDQHHGFAVAHQRGAVGLFGDLAYFNG
jgi:hypothetical protein